MNTESVISYLVILFAAYLIGSIPWGLFIGKLCGKDIRDYGSGNIGATNVTRVIGKFAGRVCFLLDLLKGFVPVLAVSLLIQNDMINDKYELAQIAAALGAVLGHMFSIYLKFKGGKGVSTSAGALLAMAPYSFLIAGAVWVVVFLVSRYVSLASIAAAAVLPVSATFFSVFKVYPLSVYVLIFLYFLAALAILRHSANIRRLMNGTENRFEKKKPQPQEDANV